MNLKTLPFSMNDMNNITAGREIYIQNGMFYTNIGKKKKKGFFFGNII